MIEPMKDALVLTCVAPLPIIRIVSLCLINLSPHFLLSSSKDSGLCVCMLPSTKLYACLRICNTPFCMKTDSIYYIELAQV